MKNTERIRLLYQNDCAFKRKEQIEKAATDYINSDAVSPMNMQLAFGDFINGAKWADNTMIEKAAAWLYDHLTSEYQGAVLKIVAKDKGKMPVEFVEEFKKAMQE